MNLTRPYSKPIDHTSAKIMIATYALIVGVVLGLVFSYFSYKTIFINSGAIYSSGNVYHVIPEEEYKQLKDYNRYLLQELDIAHYKLRKSTAAEELDPYQP